MRKSSIVVLNTIGSFQDIEIGPAVIAVFYVSVLKSRKMKDFLWYRSRICNAHLKQNSGVVTGAKLIRHMCFIVNYSDPRLHSVCGGGGGGGEAVGVWNREVWMAQKSEIRSTHNHPPPLEIWDCEISPVLDSGSQMQNPPSPGL